MARTNRRDVLAAGEIQVVHCINRCVRRAYLCGQDPLTGTDYEHRRELIRQRLEFLAGIMGIEVLGYSVMSNHFHCILRSRHDVVETWSDEDVARKWWLLCPSRKNIAKNPESSDFTSVQDRIVDLKTTGEVSTPDAQDNRIEHGERAGWLAPIPLEPKRRAVRAKTTIRRASNKGCLSLGLGDYLQLLDWTGRQIRSDKRGAMPANLEPLFERLGISTELWVDCVLNFRKWFRSSVGRPKSMEAAAETRGHNRAISINSARRAFK